VAAGTCIKGRETLGSRDLQAKTSKNNPDKNNVDLKLFFRKICLTSIIKLAKKNDGQLNSCIPKVRKSVYELE
jgi:hypothetical protein